MTLNEVYTILLYQHNLLVTQRLLSAVLENLRIEDQELNDVKQYPEQYYEGYGI